MNRFIKLLFAGAFVATALPSAAQSETSPVVIEGGKEYTVTDNTAYFSFTPSVNEIVKLNGLYLNMTTEKVTASSNGNSTSFIPAIKYDPRFTAFVAEKGVTYTFSHTIGYGEQTPYTISCEVVPLKGNVNGTTCSAPIDMTGLEYFVFPCSTGTPVYAEYTAPQSGRLFLNSIASFTALKVGGTCGEIYDVLSRGEYTNGYYPYEIIVDEDETLIFEATASNNVYVSIQLQEIIPGATCQDAFQTKVGSNEIPAAAGKYWYSVEVPEEQANCMLALTSTSTATVSISKGCKTAGTAYQNLNLRYGPLSAGENLFLEIDKEETTLPETFTLEYSDLLPIENVKIGESINSADKIQTPSNPGKYYYSFTAPEGDPMLLDFTGDSNGTYTLTERGTTSPSLATGSKFQLKTTPGMTYILTVNVNEAKPCNFEFTFNTLFPGALVNYPIDVDFGTTEIPDFSPVYFRYNNPDGGKVALSSDIENASIGVFEILYNNEYKVKLNDDDKGLWFEAQAGKDYYIRLTKPEDMASHSGNLTLSEVPYEEGESWQTALKINPGTVSLPEAPAVVWYQVEAPKDCFFTLSTSLEYDYDDIMEVYVGKVNKETVEYLKAGDNWEYAPFKTAVRKGETVYLHFDYYYGSDAETITIGFEEAAEGEIPSKAIQLTYSDPSCQFSFLDTWDEEEEVDKTIWYTVELPAGIFDCTSSTEIYLSIYSADNLSTPIASTDRGNGLSNVELPEEGKYYIALLSAYGDGEATISVREPEPGETIATAVEVDRKNLPYSIQVPDHTNKNYWIQFSAISGELNATSPQSITGSLYFGENMENKIADLQSRNENDGTIYGLFGYRISKEGIYYLNIRYCTNGATLTFSGSALDDIPSNINSIGAEATICVADGKIILKNLGFGEQIYVYSLNGMLLRHLTIQSENVEIKVPSGIYIIQGNTFAKKVTL
ncbi:MAG: hypothetical protein K2H96_00490 [Muribaculaceae bacterium]|nr:hypothetical protein [Muribaculaceae bacterium]